MSLSSPVNRVGYPGAGSTGPFAYTYRIFAASDLLVTKRSTADVETTLTYAADYTVDGVGNDSGNVTLTTALGVGEHLVIRRAPALTQETSVRNQGPYFAKSIEDQFDILAAQIQAIDDRARRSFGVSESYDPATFTLVLKPETGKVLGWDSSTLLTNKTLDSSAVALPGGGRTVATLSAYLSNNLVYNVKDYGAYQDGAHDDSVAIAAAEGAAYAVGGLLHFPSGANAFYTGTTTTTIRCHVEATGALISYAGTVLGLLVGQAGANTHYLHAGLPEIQQALKTVPGWAQAGGSDVGTRLLNLMSSFIYIPHVKNFAVGVDVRGQGRGNAYNHIWPGFLDNNKVNFQSSADATGYSNENSVHGGRFYHASAEGVAVAGTRHILIPTSANAPNNWRFLHCSLEGDVAEFHVECFGLSNLWDHCRWEVTGGARFQFNGVDAVNNVVRHGYKSEQIVFTEINAAVRNNLQSPSKNRYYASVGVNGYLFGLASSSSSADMLLVTFPAGKSPLTTPVGERTFGLSSNEFHGKATGDAGYRVQITSALGRVGFCGDGTLTTPTDYFVGVGTDGIKHVGTKFGFFGTAPVAKPAAVGSRAGNAALASLLTQLAALGLITDSTTA